MESGRGERRGRILRSGVLRNGLGWVLVYYVYVCVCLERRCSRDRYEILTSASSYTCNNCVEFTSRHPWPLEMDVAYFIVGLKIVLRYQPKYN